MSHTWLPLGLTGTSGISAGSTTVPVLVVTAMLMALSSRFWSRYRYRFSTTLLRRSFSTSCRSRRGRLRVRLLRDLLLLLALAAHHAQVRLQRYQVVLDGLAHVVDLLVHQLQVRMVRPQLARLLFALRQQGVEALQLIAERVTLLMLRFVGRYSCASMPLESTPSIWSIISICTSRLRVFGRSPPVRSKASSLPPPVPP